MEAMIFLLFFVVIASVIYCIAELKRENNRIDCLWNEHIIQQGVVESNGASIKAHTENLAELNDAIYGLKQYVSNNRTEKLNERLNAYAALRADGKTKKEAAAEIGISYRTASRYEKSIVDLD